MVHDSYLFANVDSCRLHIEKYHTSITFSTTSDALLSSLYVKHSTILGLKAIDLFDDILQLLRLERFFPHELTIRESFDIIDRIVQGRLLNQMERNAKNPQPGYEPGHTQVVDLVANHLESEIWNNAQTSHVHTDDIEVEDVLKSMSLVHRS